MPEKENNRVPNFLQQFNTTRPGNFVEQDIPTEQRPEVPIFTSQPREPGHGVLDHRRDYVVDRGNTNRWSNERRKNAEMQDRLFELGAYGEGAVRDKVVDGLVGKQTRAALAKAEELGYVYNSASNTFSKKPTVQNDKLVARSRTVSQERMDRGKQQFMRGVGTQKGTTMLTISPEGFMDMGQGAKDFILGAIGQSPLGKLVSKKTISMYDNMYPYSYGDVLVNTKTGETTPYNGGEVPAGYTLRQTTANDNERVQGQSALSKIMSSSKGKDPRREYMDQMAALDLNTAEGQAQWARMVKEAPKGMVYLHGNPREDQFIMRARLDQMNMYSGRPQQWDTYEINPDYESPTAKARGSSTYRIKDPEMRAMINGQMANYFIKHANEGHSSQDGKFWILPNMGYMGNQSLIADDKNGTNLRYGDWWDYTIDAPQASRFYTGDLLTEPGKTPVYQAKYGLGRNHAEMTESTDDLMGAIADSYKEEVRNRFNQVKQNVGNYFNQGKQVAGKYFSQGTKAAKNFLKTNLGITMSQNGGKLIPRNTNN